jgi:hypothetical protein
VIIPCKLDFGDAPISYGTTLAGNGARHVPVGPQLGSSRDVEADGQPSASADGDDLSGTDDEDGVGISVLLIGQTTNVSVQLAAAPTARLDAWVDFNGNGTFDPAEQIATSYPLVAGTNNLPIIVPVSALPGSRTARFRVSTQGGLGATGLAMNGEVEDYAVVLRRPSEFDFGDAPDSYGTTLANVGAQHVVGGPILGSLIDVETDGQPSPLADRDDNTVSDDEDGIWMGPLSAGGVTDVIVTLGNATNASLDAWIDFNGNGVFDHPVEHVFQASPLTTGPTTHVFVTPANAAAQVTYARFRVSTTGGLLPTGFGGPGEVEDYRVVIQPGSSPGGRVVPNEQGTFTIAVADLAAPAIAALLPERVATLNDDDMNESATQIATQNAIAQHGDANRDRRFDAWDLQHVFQAGRYEIGAVADWRQGDWNGDGLFTTTDLIVAFQVGWYQSGPIGSGF